MFVETWVEDAISLVQPLLLSFFNDYIRSFIETLRTRIRNREGGLNNIGKVVFSDFLFNRQPLVVDDEIASELNGTFSNLYPNLSRELEKTRAELPILVKREIDGMKHYDEIIRRQKMCKQHGYIPKDDFGEYRVLKCKRCGKIKREEK